QGELLAQPWLKRFYQRARALLPDGSTLIGATTTDLALDAVQAGDTRQCLGGDRRGAGLCQFIEAAADMAPAEGELYVAALGQHLVAGITIDLKHAAEAGKM